MLTWLKKLFGGSRFVEEMQVYNAPDAVAVLFNNGAVASVAAAPHDDIRACYVDVAESWGDNGLYRGTVAQIQDMVRANLTELVTEPDFITLKLQTIRRGPANAAQVSAILRGRGMVGIRIWKAQDGLLYVCGSPSFKGKKSLLATTSADEKKEGAASCPRCGKAARVEKASTLLEGRACSSCGWAAVWCYGCRKAPMRATRQGMVELGTGRRSSMVFLKCESCGKDKRADESVTRWLQERGAEIQDV